MQHAKESTIIGLDGISRGEMCFGESKHLLKKPKNRLNVSLIRIESHWTINRLSKGKVKINHRYSDEFLIEKKGD